MGKFVLYLILTGLDGGFVDMEKIGGYSDRSHCIKAATMLTSANKSGNEHEAVFINNKLIPNSINHYRSNSIRFACITVFDEESPFSGDKKQ